MQFACNLAQIYGSQSEAAICARNQEEKKVLVPGSEKPPLHPLDFVFNVGDYSSVLFKIEKLQKLTYDIAQEIVLKEQQEKQSKEKK